MKKLLRIIVIVFVAVISLGYVYTTSGEEAPTKEIIYIVKPGDTLWEIAQIECPDESRDIREVVYEIKNRNKLTDVSLFPGQKLLIKVKE